MKKINLIIFILIIIFLYSCNDNKQHIKIKKIKNVKNIINKIILNKNKIYYFERGIGIKSYNLKTGKIQKIFDINNINFVLTYKDIKGNLIQKKIKKIVNNQIINIDINNKGDKVLLCFALEDEEGNYYPQNIFIYNITNKNIKQVMNLKEEEYKYIDKDTLIPVKKKKIGLKWKYAEAFFGKDDNYIIFRRERIKKEVGMYNINKQKIYIFSDRDIMNSIPPLFVMKNTNTAYFNIVKMGGEINGLKYDFDTAKKTYYKPFQTNFLIYDKYFYFYGMKIYRQRIKNDDKKEEIFSIKKYKNKLITKNEKIYSKKINSMIINKNVIYFSTKDGNLYKIYLKNKDG